MKLSKNKKNNLKDFEIDGTTLIRYNGNSANVVLPDTVTEIDPYAFEGCDFIKSVTISRNVKDIICPPMLAVFSFCPNLEELIVDDYNVQYYSQDNCVIEKESKTLIVGCKNSVIPADVTAIGEGAFCDCRGLTSVIIPNNVTSISEGAFYGCEKLKSIIIPNSVTSIGLAAFSCCSNLEEITVDGENSVYYSQGNCLVEKESKTLILGCKSSVIPDNVKCIGNSSFFGCNGLTNIVVPNSVTNIGSNAFDSCSGLTNITIPDSVTNIGETAFRKCDSLTSITISNSMTMIEEWVFYGCTSLTSIEIPNSITYIKGGAFNGCIELTDIKFKGTKSQLGAIMLDDGWNDNIGDYIFHCTDGDVDKYGNDVKS